MHQRNTISKYRLQRKPVMKQIQIDTHFHLSLILMLKNPVFPRRVKIPYQQLIMILSFITELQYERIIHSYYSSTVS